MKKLKYSVEIEVTDSLYELLQATAKYSNGMTVPEAFRQLIAESLADNTFEANEYVATVTYIEQEEQ